MHMCNLLSYRLAACRNRYSDVVLVIMYNVAFPGWLDVHKQVRAAYRPLFRQIIYTGFHRQVTAFDCSGPCMLHLSMHQPCNC